MARLNPEYLQQLAIKAVQDLAESSHYLYASIKAVDFQCIPPHDNVLGGVSFSFLPRIAQNGASFARVLILDNWMRKIEWYEYEYGQLVDETKELLPESMEKAWLEHTGIPVREPIGLDENDVKIGSVLITEAVRKKLPGSEINGILYRHSKHDWEKLFWFLRYLIPGLHVNTPGDDRLRDLLDSVDLNTYGLRRTALNESVVLDAGESTIDPLKPSMAGAGEKDTSETPLDQILKDFNEKWFKGWDATPDDQKAKIISITRAVAEDEDYKNLVVGNTDKEAVDRIMPIIIDKAIRLKRRGDMSLYREYQQNESFKYHFREMITRMLAFSLSSSVFEYPTPEGKVLEAAEDC